MSAWIAWAIGLPAFAALSFAMERHQEQAFGRVLSPRAGLAWRSAGVLLLAVSLAVCTSSAWSWSVAIAAWFGLLTFAALTAGWMLTYAPRRLLPLGCATLAAGTTAWALRTALAG